MNENFFVHTIGFNEYITGNKFIDICERTGATFSKIDNLAEFGSQTPKVFVTHNGDYPINEQRFNLAPHHYDCWLAQNKGIDNEKVIGIPIGLENMRLRTSLAARGGAFSSQIEGALEKATIINKYNHFHLKKKGLVYMNFNVHTYRSEREPLWKKFIDKDWVTTTQSLPMQKFYFEMATHKFIFSPRGNGVDCHRTWEALYSKTIPIVRKSTCMNEFKELPILFVDSWDEVTLPFLNEKYEEMSNTLYNLDKIKISYWEKVINEKLSS